MSSFPFTDGPRTQQDARTAPNGAPPNGAPQQQPPIYPPRRRPRIPALALGAYGAGLLGVILAAVVLALFISYRGQATAQLNSVQQQLKSTQSTLAKFKSDQGIKYTHLSGEVNNLGNMIGPYNMICSTDLQGQNGPAQYWFPCSGAKP
jgi:hypothetical protein